METTITAFVIVAAVAIVIQMGILAGMYVSMKKTAARVDKLSAQVEEHGVPALAAAKTLLVENGPKITATIENAYEASVTLRQQVQRVDATVTDLVDRTRLQVIRADELVSRTLDHVEETTELVHHTVISPVRQIAGVVQAVTTGAGLLFGRLRGARQRNGEGGPEDEMFI